MKAKKWKRGMEYQRLRVIDTGKDCGEGSPYRKWVADNSPSGDESFEGAIANPDMLTDSTNVYPQETKHYSVGDISRQLSGQQKRVFELYVNEGLSEKDIAAVLEIGINTVRTHLRRVRDRFKHYM